MSVHEVLAQMSDVAPTALASAEPAGLLPARQQMALSLGWHIIIACFGVAFPAIIFVMHLRGIRRGDQVALDLAKRWAKVSAVLFAIGAVSGTVLSFEMGLLWPGLMGRFGDVLGLPFAFEGLSFFVEAIFLGIYLYGWNRMSPRAHFVSGIPIVVAGLTGSLFVISVNAWMNDPGGFTLTAAGTVTDVDPIKALFGNGHLAYQLIHMYLAGFIVCGFLVAAAYAVGRLRGRWGRYERIALTIPLTVAALAAPVQLLVGDWAAREVAKSQPTKLAALEGVGHTERGAPLHLLGWYSDGKVKAGIPVPKGLSLLAFHDPNAEVQGLDAVAPKDRPPVNVVRVAFQLMVAIGTFLAALSAWYLYARTRRRRVPSGVWFYRLLVVAGPASVVALIAGWVTTEVGRQPWVVYEVMRTEQAVTAAHGIPVGYATLAEFCARLIAAVAWILRRLARAPMKSYDTPERALGEG
jgi:cytochrome d ubiquinol oxidase subunit I